MQLVGCHCFFEWIDNGHTIAKDNLFFFKTSLPVDWICQYARSMKSKWLPPLSQAAAWRERLILIKWGTFFRIQAYWAYGASVHILLDILDLDEWCGQNYSGQILKLGRICLRAGLNFMDVSMWVGCMVYGFYNSSITGFDLRQVWQQITLHRF